VLGGGPELGLEIRKLLRSLNPEQLFGEVRARLSTLDPVPVDGPLSRLEGKVNQFCTLICLDRLYARLTEPTQQMLSRAAVSSGQISPEGLAAITMASTEDLPEMLDTAYSWSMIHSARGDDAKLWSVYGTVRAWLRSNGKSSVDDRRQSHRALAEYLSEIVSQHREAEWGSTELECLMQSRSHFLISGYGGVP
jgi:hypothetical protein